MGIDNVEWRLTEWMWNGNGQGPIVLYPILTTLLLFRSVLFQRLCVFFLSGEQEGWIAPIP